MVPPADGPLLAPLFDLLGYDEVMTEAVGGLLAGVPADKCSGDLWCEGRKESVLRSADRSDGSCTRTEDRVETRVGDCANMESWRLMNLVTAAIVVIHAPRTLRPKSRLQSPPSAWLADF